MTPDESAQPDSSLCHRAQACPGWIVTSEGYVKRCGECSRFTQEAACRAARAAGLDVRRNGFVVGLRLRARDAGAPRSAEQLALARTNDLLVGALELVQDAARADLLPLALRETLATLAVEVARVQGVAEWLAEDLVRVVGGEEEGDASA